MFALRRALRSFRDSIAGSDLGEQTAFFLYFAGKEKPREAKQLAQGHTARQWQNMTPGSFHSLTQPPVRLMAGGAVPTLDLR